MQSQEAGYIIRSRNRDKRGCLRGSDYVIYEQPPMLENPILEKPVLGNPIQ